MVITSITDERYQHLTAMRIVALAALAALHPDEVRTRRAVLHALAEVERALGCERTVPRQNDRRALTRQ